MITTAKLASVALAALALSTSLSFADNPMIGGIGSIQVPAGTPEPSGNPMASGISSIQVPGSGGSSSSADAGPVAGRTSGGSQDSGRDTSVAVKLGRLVAGTPIEFPNDLYITNKGSAPLRAGTKLKFAVQSTGAKGALLLHTDIAVGAQVKVADILNGGAEAGAPCTAKVL